MAEYGSTEQIDEALDERIALSQRLDQAGFRQMAPWRRVRNALAHMMEPYL